jgi:excisionase family DNA binding protein
VSERLLKTSDVATLAGICDKTVRQEISDGRLRAYRIGNGFRISPKDLDDWLEDRLVTRESAPKPVSLRRGDPNETAFGKMAREVDSAGRPQEATAVLEQEAR